MFKYSELKRNASWHTLLTFAWIIFLTQAQASIHLNYLHLESNLFQYRVAHSVFAFCCIIGLMIYKKHWKSEYSTPIFLAILIPTYVVAWISQNTLSMTGNSWSPMIPFKFYPMVLAFLVPTSYLLNLILILAWVIEGTVLWITLDQPHGNEPMLTILFVVVAFILLYFRYRDEKLILKLSKKQERDILQANLARVFMSIKDQSNTPLQTLKISNTLLKLKLPDEEILDIQEKSIDHLILLGQFMNSSDKMSWSDQKLMTDQEILQWINSLEDLNPEV